MWQGYTILILSFETDEDKTMGTWIKDKRTLESYIQ